MSGSGLRGEVLGRAIHEYRSANLAQAELLCRHHLRACGEDAQAWNLLGLIASSVEQLDKAEEYHLRALNLAPASAEITENIAIVRRRRACAAAHRSESKCSPAKRISYHLIKSWGCGFWSDVNQVLGHLLLAEITGRIPVVHWGGNSLFSDSSGENAYEYYFRSQSSDTLSALSQTGLTFFPSKWASHNIADNDNRKWNGPGSRMAPLYYLGRDEDVTVGDFVALVADVGEWLPGSHPLRNKTLEERYKRLFSLHIRPHAEYLDAAERFCHAHFRGYPSIAVHVRGGDKVAESPDLWALNRRYPEYINKFLIRCPDARIFLFTDSTDVLSSYRAFYGDRVVTTNCARTDCHEGVHFQRHPSRKSLGAEVLLDALIAVRCDYFIGNGDSSVSNAVYHMKDWGREDVELLGGCRWYHSNLLLYDRERFRPSD